MDLGLIMYKPEGIHFQNYINLFKLNNVLPSAFISVSRTILGTALPVIFTTILGYLFTKEHIYSVTGKLADWLPYGVDYDPLTKTGYSIFTEGSTYYRGLKFLYQMNQAGLIAPDSLSQSRSTAWTKIDSGAALAGPATPAGRTRATIPLRLRSSSLPTPPLPLSPPLATASPPSARMLRLPASCWTPCVTKKPC